MNFVLARLFFVNCIFSDYSITDFFSSKFDFFLVESVVSVGGCRLGEDGWADGYM